MEKFLSVNIFNKMDVSRETTHILMFIRSYLSCLPLSILTATVSQLLLLLIPNAEASITFPKAPWPRTLPEK